MLVSASLEPALERPAHGGRILAVRQGSLAERIGLRPGDVLLAVNGLVPRDLIDLGFGLAEPQVRLDVARGQERLSFELEGAAGLDLGVEFSDAVFAGIRQCNNHCEFCFIRGLPRGLRPSLYVFDDDYRYSFLYGNFLTLTNLEEADWERIGYQKLSPLWVSVHATDLEVRRRLLVNPRAPDIVAQLRRLGAMGIEVHAQIVLCPGINDGVVLEESIDTLADLWPAVVDVAVVPVGLTRYSRVRNIRPNTVEEAARVVRLIEARQRRFRARFGIGLVYASDEWYLLAGRRLPAAHAYDGYPHLMNGVGLTRFLLGQWARVRRRVPTRLPIRWRVVWVCGRAAAPALRSIAVTLAQVENLELEVREVENTFFGEGVVVSGLLAGRDLLRTVRAVEADLVLLPGSAFGVDGRTLDDVTLEEVQAAAKARIEVGTGAEDLLSSVMRGLERPLTPRYYT